MMQLLNSIVAADSVILTIIAADENQADSTGSAQILFGMLLVTMTLVFYWRARGRKRKTVEHSPAPFDDESRHDSLKRHQSFLQELEVRMYDYSREVEGRIETRLSVLDQLVADAQRETDRLEELLQLTQEGKQQFSDVPEDRSLTQAVEGILSIARAEGDTLAGEFSAEGHSAPHFSEEQREMIIYLHQAGFRPDEIARCMERTVSEIERVLARHGEGPSSKAA